MIEAVKEARALGQTDDLDIVLGIAPKNCIQRPRADLCQTRYKTSTSVKGTICIGRAMLPVQPRMNIWKWFHKVSSWPQHRPEQQLKALETGGLFRLLARLMMTGQQDVE
jgi:hypothetical protein